MSAIGYNLVGGSNVNFGGSAIYGTLFSTTGSITITNMYVYFNSVSGTMNALPCIYDADTSNNPANLIASGSTVSGISTTPGWTMFSFPSTVLSASTPYWLFVTCDVNPESYYIGGVANQGAWNMLSSWNALPANYTSSYVPTYGTWLWSIVASGSSGLTVLMSGNGTIIL